MTKLKRVSSMDQFIDMLKYHAVQTAISQQSYEDNGEWTHIYRDHAGNVIAREERLTPRMAGICWWKRKFGKHLFVDEQAFRKCIMDIKWQQIGGTDMPKYYHEVMKHKAFMNRGGKHVNNNVRLSPASV